MAKPTATEPALFEAGSTLHRFLLVISPAPELSAQVRRLKDELFARIGSYSGRHSIPHITLFFADLPGEYERDIADGVANGVIGQKAFTLHYNGIAHFPDQRTIYIDPADKESIALVRQRIVDHVRAFPGLRRGVSPTAHPHLTIAAGLKPAQFDKAWEMLAPHEHRSEERVEEVVLLKRPLKLGMTYELVSRFPLG